MEDDIRTLYARWLTRAFVKWQAVEGKRKTLDDFAAFLGYKRPRISHYLNGKYIPPYEVALQISQRLNDYEGVRILGYPAPQDHSFLPEDIRRDLDAAEAEVNKVFAERGLTGEMPEAEQVTKAIFEKWGFRYIDTTEMEDK